LRAASSTSKQRSVADSVPMAFPSKREIVAYLEQYDISKIVQRGVNAAILQRSSNPARTIAEELLKYSPPGDKPVVFFILGGPGSGKGTQCSNIVQTFGYKHLSAGDLLREERKSGSEQGALIEAYIKEGKIVPVEITVKLLLKAIEEDGGSRFLVDGFPRNTNNLAGWHGTVGERLRVAGVLTFEVSDDVLVERLLERGKTSGRSDDNMESVKKRLVTYHNDTMPVIEYFRQMGMLWSIDGEQSIDAVWEHTKAAIEAAVQKLDS